MQTAAIPYRVADFLKQHPPFQFIDEPDLVALASRGRVKFHTADEYICWQSSPHTPYLYVIQQGSVSLWDESSDPPTLRDIRGAGDSIGIERFKGSPASLYSAKAASEVMIYALYAADFEPLLARYPRAAQYVAAYSAVTADYQASGERSQPHEIFLADLVRDRAPLQCPASTSIQEAARLLSESGAQALALTYGKDLAAFLTPADLLHWIASGASLESALAECGYLSPEPLLAGSLEEWKARFSGWIRDPISTQVYHSRPCFDLRPVHGPGQIFLALESHVRAELAAEPAFLRILANDCLSSLPPLTFYRDLVVEESGERTDTFRLKTSVLEPLVDVARVFSLASGSPLGASTRERFQRARRLLPSQDSIFREASETMRVVLYHQARAGLRLRSSGADLPLSILSRLDRQVLKSGFRSVHNLLAYTASCDWLESL